MRLYREYLKAATGAELIETEKGFAVCRVVGCELYVAEFFAKTPHAAVDIFRKLKDKAIIEKCLVITAHVENYFPAAKALLKLFVRLGFQIHSATEEKTAIFIPAEPPLKWIKAVAVADLSTP